MLIEAHPSAGSGSFEGRQSERPSIVRRPEVSLPVMPTSERRDRPRTVRVAEMVALEVES